MDQYVAQINLVLQIIILLLFATSMAFKRQAKLQRHGFVMLLAVILNTVSIAAVMIPSFQTKTEPILSQPSQTFSIIVFLHVTMGVIAEVLALVLVIAWRLRNPKYCFRRKSIMRITSPVWVVALVSGVVMYMLLYTSLIG